MPEAATGAMLRARASQRQELAGLKRRARPLVQDDPVCFTSSKTVGPWVGLTLPRNQSGARDVSGDITKAGDATLRCALCQAATVMVHRGRSNWLRTWAAQVARRRGAKRAMVALARRVAVILHRMWVDDTGFRSDITVRPDDLISQLSPA